MCIIDNEERHGALAVAQPVQMVGLDLFGRRHKPNMHGRALRKSLGRIVGCRLVTLALNTSAGRMVGLIARMLERI